MGFIPIPPCGIAKETSVHMVKNPPTHILKCEVDDLFPEGFTRFGM